MDAKEVANFKNYEKDMKKLGVNPDTLDVGSPTKADDSDEENKGETKERKTLIEQQASSNMPSI